MTGGIGSLSVVARTVGIGLAAAAIGASEQVAVTRPRFVVFLGTCGAYGEPSSARPSASGPAIGDVVVADRVMLVEPSVVAGTSEFPEAISTMIRCDGGIRDGLATAGARPVSVATTLAITVDDGIAAQIARATGAHVEHLEAHSVAMACELRGVLFSALLGVANIVGAKAREQWRANHRRAADAAAQYLLRWLEQGARGAPR
jgi:nucleoside phosphorylase